MKVLTLMLMKPFLAIMKQWTREERSNPTQPKSPERFYPWWYLVPLYPYSQKPTLRFEVVPDWIWCFEQYQGIFYVVVPIRMTVIRLEAGGLLVYAPIALTSECLGLVRELEAQYGAVQYIILPTVSGLEHKAVVGPFARQFPQARVYVAHGQWSFPLNLPLSWLGFPAQRTHFLPVDSSKIPFYAEFDYRMLGPIDLNLGQFGEVALFHRRSQTVLVTDTLISIPQEPPPILHLDPYPLLFHAKDQARERILNSPENRRKGWQRICLFALYFQASTLEVAKFSQAVQDAQQAWDRSAKAFWGIFPFQWLSSWPQSFQQLRGNGRLLVAPILQELILNRQPQQTLDWADQITQWNFNRLIPCHFDAPLTVTPQQFRQAFAFLDKQLSRDQAALIPENHPLPLEDLATLKSIDQFLYRYRITPSPYRYPRS